MISIFTKLWTRSKSWIIANISKEIAAISYVELGQGQSTHPRDRMDRQY